MDRRKYNKDWRRANPRLNKELQADWYRRNGKTHYAKNAVKHREINRTTYARSVGLTRSQIMARIKSVSGVELAARSMATLAAGCLLRHQPREIFGKPDYANKSKKVAVFVDGCWWHMCPRHFKMPKTNTPFWRKKFLRNVERRKEVSRQLKKEGWTVLSIWEHDLTAAAARRGRSAAEARRVSRTARTRP